MSDRYCLIGEQVSGSLSPAMMNAAFRAAGLDAVYEAVNIPRAEFKERFLQLREETEGLNITIPYKSTVIPFLDELDPVSSRIGAVNVVKHSGARFVGYNTDANGIVAPLRDHGRDGVRSALLIGAGGAARAFCEAMDELGCSQVTVAVRAPSKGESFIREMSKIFPRVKFGFTALSLMPRTEADLVFNATPIGSGDHEIPETLKRAIHGRSTVFDAVYRPMKTELLKTAELRGCTVIYGYEMLLNQGVLAFELWTGRKAPKEAMRRALLESLGADAS